jgi:hypothetical protein
VQELAADLRGEVQQQKLSGQRTSLRQSIHQREGFPANQAIRHT